jgi:hypothetical protein
LRAAAPGLPLSDLSPRALASGGGGEEAEAEEGGAAGAAGEEERAARPQLAAAAAALPPLLRALVTWLRGATLVQGLATDLEACDAARRQAGLKEGDAIAVVAP